MIEELESLLFDWEAGTLDDAGIERVRKILRSSEEAKTLFARQHVLSAAMKLNCDAGLEPVAVSDGPDVTAAQPSTWQWLANRIFHVSRLAVVIAGFLFCVLAGRLLYLEFATSTPNPLAEANDSPRGESTEAMSAGVAVVTELVDVEWESAQTPLTVGDAVMPGRVAIAAGFAQIEFFCGATVIVEGPAEIDLKSASLARVISGRLRAQVPPAARGFTLDVDEMKVVDLGTEFGLSVSSEGTDIQVFDGEVEIYPSKEDRQLLTAGHAILRNADGQFESGRMTPERFLNIASMETRAENQRAARFENWKTWSDELRHDPRLIAYYSFADTGNWGRKLHSSAIPDNNELDGAIVGASRNQGRWSEKSGLEFKRPGDRVRVQIPGEFRSLTFACWVKIDSLDRWYNSLFLTDHYNQGEPHWQILDSGQLFFSVRAKRDPTQGEREVKGQTHQEILSPSFWKPSMSGRWLHLATTYDAERAVTTHYLNGRVIHEESIDKAMVVQTTKIGAATIGNWTSPTRPDSEFAIRNINGSIDEFAIFATALSAEEIKAMHENGQP